MSFYNEYLKYKGLNLDDVFKRANDNDVRRVLAKDSLEWEDFLILLSPVATKHLEEMAQRANKETIQNFGRVIFLYAPLYLSDHCVNQCAYCGFNVKNKFKRKKLNIEEIRREGEAIAKKGIKHLLILTGESRKHSPVSYIKEAVEALKDYFSSIDIEIYPLYKGEYEELIEAGVDGLTIYQEVYNEEIYDQVHITGPKKDYRYRLDAPERGAKAGMRRINIGPLFGLDDWRKEAFFSAIHTQYLQKNYLDLELALSLPRLRPHLGSFQPKSIVSDRDLVQIILAYRLFLPRVGISLSTREGENLRDNLLPLGITKLSAESSTAVGGYTQKDSTDQFAISDGRSLKEIKKLLLEKGYQPILQDWHRI
ncbi:2-iminoacetate synthase ThiH [Halonatronum saccharophilum]|uniref:2-iminoacetate synthase ThiH n=1 Tax=Halonatronum saccharophilum TaxID=150060 RepID=UPI00048390D8|nr:2-iminoacetate synthase ThiH [Halonatronum saccharophilum]